MRAKKVARGCQRPPFYARAGCCARNYAVCTKYSKARPGCACTQEVMRAKKVNGVLGVVEIAARFPLPLPTDELM
jgi:hypothetical protein